MRQSAHVSRSVRLAPGSSQSLMPCVRGCSQVAMLDDAQDMLVEVTVSEDESTLPARLGPRCKLCTR